MQPKLKILDIFYGNKCNLTCFQCDTRSDIFRKGEYDPSIENIKQGIDLARSKFLIENYTLLGGEPLMYIDGIVELAKYIRSFDSNTTLMIPTNGILIDRHMDAMVKLVKEQKVLFIVSDHLTNFEDKTRSQKVKDNAIALGNAIGIEQKDPVNFFYDVFDWKNTKGDSHWQSWLDNVKGDISEGLENDLSFMEDRHGVIYKDYGVFQSHHKIDENNKPKPFNSNDPDGSYHNGCCSPFCTFMHDKKLYKCGALGTLKRFLHHHGSLNDPDWELYLEYKPLDLETCTQEDVNQFNLDKFRSIKQCSMCPNVCTDFEKTPDKVLPNFRFKNA